MYLPMYIYIYTFVAVVFGNILMPKAILLHHNDVTFQKKKLTFRYFFVENHIHTYMDI